MILFDSAGTAVDWKSFHHFVFCRHGLQLCGSSPFFLSGQNLHFLAPFIYHDAVPRDMLSSRRELLPRVFSPPFSLHVSEITTEEQTFCEATDGLGFPLAHEVPFGEVRWFALEGANFTAIHRARDFVILAPREADRCWNIEFRSQAYGFEFADEETESDFIDNLETRFPSDAEFVDPRWRNIFSVFSAPQPRFSCLSLWMLSRRGVECSNRKRLPQRLQRLCDSRGTQPPPELRGPDL